MARPRKGTEEVWYDTFSEWPEDDRAAALKVLTHLHRALSRKERQTTEPEQELQIELHAGESDPKHEEVLRSALTSMSMRGGSNGGA